MNKEKAESVKRNSFLVVEKGGWAESCYEVCSYQAQLFETALRKSKKTQMGKIRMGEPLEEILNDYFEGSTQEPAESPCKNCIRRLVFNGNNTIKCYLCETASRYFEEKGLHLNECAFRVENTEENVQKFIDSILVADADTKERLARKLARARAK